MVNRSAHLDAVFGSLSHPIRRDILQRVAREELTSTELARAYEISLVAVTKHLNVLENARLIVKRRQGKERFVRLAPAAVHEAAEYLQLYRAYWEAQFDKLEKYLENEKRSSRG